ncbi:hypothetical protein CLV30_12421 [Haloactinopolyspora alba]|uniref:Uncharacterized protein n=1 Tax=Haloactinopolyspora alba TaxID=648780 RepID=A0A2P8DI94_9ACTN|nr:hypothetical protein [Haloactinopolyspora alba]PSK96937.1 hypothetical protein CLV30_12421 [Haloactinopolyspora alba]
MSETPDTGGGEPRETTQPSEDELRAYLEQLRPLPAEQVLAEVFSTVLTAAQAKLGRHDARLLIDTAGLAFEHTRAHLGDEAADQFEQVLNQLRMAQVQAERQTGGEGEENDLPSAPAAPQTSQPTAAQPQQPEQPATSKLWLPGS